MEHGVFVSLWGGIESSALAFVARLIDCSSIYSGLNLVIWYCELLLTMTWSTIQHQCKYKPTTPLHPVSLGLTWYAATYRLPHLSSEANVSGHLL
jgi:hypothetical protein